MKECPFCDENNFDIVVPFSNTQYICVRCTNCGATGPTVSLDDTSIGMAEEMALDKWTIRPTEERLTRMVLDTERRLRRGQ